jgi:hypothetical protein
MKQIFFQVRMDFIHILFVIKVPTITFSANNNLRALSELNHIPELFLFRNAPAVIFIPSKVTARHIVNKDSPTRFPLERISAHVQNPCILYACNINSSRRFKRT